MNQSALRWIGAFAVPVVLSRPEAAAQDRAGERRALTPPRAATAAGTARSPIRLHDQARAGELLVPLNKSQVMEVDRSCAEVSVGNREIVGPK